MQPLAPEKWLREDLYNAVSECADDDALTHGQSWDNVRWFPTDKQFKWFSRMPRQDAISGGDCTEQFGSAHYAGINFVMADGSVRLVEYAVERDVYWVMGARL